MHARQKSGLSASTRTDVPRAALTEADGWRGLDSRLKTQQFSSVDDSRLKAVKPEDVKFLMMLNYRATGLISSIVAASLNDMYGLHILNHLSGS